ALQRRGMHLLPLDPPGPRKDHGRPVPLAGILLLPVLAASTVLCPAAGRPSLALAGLLAAALVLRVAGTWSRSPDAVLVASLLHAAAFALFALWVWRSLDPPELAPLRRHLTLATGWLALACLVEVALRWRALGLPLPVPDLGGMRAVHAMGIFGGVAGWVVGVLLRAGPMFIAGWSVPSGIARAAPWLLALGAATAAVGEASRESAVARLGEFVALGGVGAIMLAGGALGRARRVLPMTARSPEEARIFRLAAVSAGVAVPGGALAALLAWAGVPIHLLTDALRHLVTVGFLASVVVAMAFRLIPVLEGAALPWPALRHVAFWALLASVLGRSAEVLVGVGGRGIAPLVPLSGLLAWIALACVAANLAGAIARLRGAPPA
ncbi:MAG: hypothetical protein HY727_22000, partial [Candidatus Rokubacteria bacterium]|nr:hypothetical protein [Candidatus Rokubacteria bacterium]